MSFALSRTMNNGGVTNQPGSEGNEAVAADEPRERPTLSERCSFVELGNGVGEINGAIGFFLDDSDPKEEDDRDSEDSLM